MRQHPRRLRRLREHRRPCQNPPCLPLLLGRLSQCQHRHLHLRLALHTPRLAMHTLRLAIMHIRHLGTAIRHHTVNRRM
jgi:hypothetical protein